jgi:3-hydroxybutyryl-CoA dehydrogenase
MAIKKVGVLGCGLMGAGIAQVAAAAGYDTLVREVDAAYIEKGFGRIKGMLAKGVEKGKVQQADMDATMGRLKGTTKLEDLADCDIIIEAIIENLDLKRETFQTLNKACGAETLFASNTSSLSITEMGAMSGRPDRFLGPALLQPGAADEARGSRARPQHLRRHDGEGPGVREDLGKAPIVAKDSPGFVVNLLLVPYLLGAIRAVEMGIATVPDIDQGMVWGAVTRWGRSRCSISWGSIPPTTSPTSCSTSSREPSTPRPRCSSGWCWRATTGGSRARGSTTTARIRRSRRPAS